MGSILTKNSEQRVDPGRRGDGLNHCAVASALGARLGGAISENGRLCRGDGTQAPSAVASKGCLTRLGAARAIFSPERGNPIPAQPGLFWRSCSGRGAPFRVPKRGGPPRIPCTRFPSQRESLMCHSLRARLLNSPVSPSFAAEAMSGRWQTCLRSIVLPR